MGEFEFALVKPWFLARRSGYNKGMSVESALQALRFDLRFVENIARIERTPARPAAYAPFPAALDTRIVEALRRRGIDALYTHQAAAIGAALRGENVVVSTPAASGKTLCYNLPVLQRLLAEPQARALYLFPTKALAHDQLAELNALTAAIPLRAAPACYDGDTPSAHRSKIRAGSRIILSNPDMLHMGILPQHPRWAAFFGSLAYVVVDEMHVYRGVFGSHVANVLRRLLRICRFYGHDPQFILASATIANPEQLAMRLIETPVSLVGPEQDGAPQGEKQIILYNPPVIDPELGIRKSAGQESAALAAHFLEHDVQTIVFGRARLATELMLTQLRDALPRDQRNRARGYRSGYLSSDRRGIEQGLRERRVSAVVTTNALELGIDIGHLDVAILSGYPGTVASARQQMGRAGRRQGVSAAILVAGAGPLDQYIIAHPRWLLERSPEHARINPDNDVILSSHLACAAAELPLRVGETLYAGSTVDASYSEKTAALLVDLVDARQLYLANGRYFWAGEGNPAQGLSLRSADADRVVIQTTGEDGEQAVIGELDREGVPLLLYKGAVYLHEGASYVVESLDWEAGLAQVRAIEANYYTRPTIGEKIEFTAIHAEREDDVIPYRAGWGDACVTSQATGYKILRRGTGELLGFGEVALPEQVLDTQACWLSFPESTIHALKAAGEWLSDPNDYGPKWPGTRDAVRQRDGYRCQGCGAAEMGGRQHDVHHKIPFRAFLSDERRREGLPPHLAWQVANRLDNLVTLCPACHHKAESGVRTRSGLGGAAALLEAVAPLFLMCDGRDLGVNVEPQDATTGLPSITIYERTPGGVGYTQQLFESLHDALQAALDLVVACACPNGCPACVGPVLEHEYALDTKKLTIALLRAAIGADLGDAGPAA
jgi:DEAD/DEAH box helicase domain-containing protein